MERTLRHFVGPGKRSGVGLGGEGGGREKKSHGGEARLPSRPPSSPGLGGRSRAGPDGTGGAAKVRGEREAALKIPRRGGGSERFYSFPFQRCRRKQRGGGEGGGQGVPPAARG